MGRVEWRPLLATACLAAAATAGAYVAWRNDAGVVEEDRLVEAAQAWLLIAAFGVHGGRALARRSPVDVRVRAGLALFCLSLALREVDVDRLSGRGIELALRTAVVVAWVVYTVWLLPRLDPLWACRRQILLSATGLLTVAGVVCYGASWPFDHMLVPVGESLSRLIEEGVLQLNATLFLLGGALFGRAWRGPGRPGAS